MSKLLQAIEQCKAAGAFVSMTSIIDDAERFATLAAFAGATVRTEWDSRFSGEPYIREYFSSTIDGVSMTVMHHRKPTIIEWTRKMEAAVAK